jgi:hypothetical protein
LHNTYVWSGKYPCYHYDGALSGGSVARCWKFFVLEELSHAKCLLLTRAALSIWNEPSRNSNYRWHCHPLLTEETKRLSHLLSDWIWRGWELRLLCGAQWVSKGDLNTLQWHFLLWAPSKMELVRMKKTNQPFLSFEGWESQKAFDFPSLAFLFQSSLSLAEFYKSINRHPPRLLWPSFLVRQP